MLRSRKALQEFLEQRGKVYFYGAGEMGQTVLEYIDRHNLNPYIAGIIDRNSGKRLGGISVTGTEILEQNKTAAVLVTTSQTYHKEILESLKDYGIREAETISDELYAQIKGHLQPLTQKDLEELEKRQMRFIPKPCLEYMVLNILDHCNLRCKGCDHFACVADPYFVPLKTIQQDVKQLAKILEGSYLISMGIMGGEPLLHPDLLSILSTVRQYFPYVEIRLTSNGLLLLKQNSEFWKTCRENQVTIVITKYPIPLQFQQMKQKAKEEKVNFYFFEGTGEGIVKKSFKKIIDIQGKNNPVSSFSRCHLANYGNFLMEGRFYGCPFSCQSQRIFNRKFGQNLVMTKEDFIDIYQVKDKKELFEFAARPKYYCRYCSGLTKELDWEQSKKSITEWVEEQEAEKSQ